MDVQWNFTNWVKTLAMTVFAARVGGLLLVGVLGVVHAAPSGPAAVNAQAVMHGSRIWPRIALTFDADLTPHMAAELKSGVVVSFDDAHIRHYLEQQHLAATFFLTGMWTEQYPTAARELASSPLFELGNHSYSHPGFVSPCYSLAKLPKGDARAEILKSQSAILKATGKTPRYFRFPGLCHNTALLETVASLGLTSVDGDVLGEDGFQKNASIVEKNVLSQVKNGAIIVLHCHGGPNAPATFAALEQIVPVLRSRGFTFVTLSELLK